MNTDRLPVCRHRGPPLSSGRWECHSPKLLVPPEGVGFDDCRLACPYVDHALDGKGARQGTSSPSRAIDESVSSSKPRMDATRPVNAVALTPGLLFGGAERWVTNLVTEPASRRFRWKSVVVTGRGSGMEPPFVERILSAGVDIITPESHAGKKRTDPRVQRFPTLETAVGNGVANADVVLIWGLGDEARLVAKHFHGPIVWVSHGSCAFTSKAYRLAQRYVTHVAAVSASAAAVFAGRDAHVVLNGVDPARCRPLRPREEMRSHWSLAPSDVAVGYVGRLSPEKNPLACVHGVAALASPFRALLVGGGWNEDETRKTARRIGGDRVVVQDHVEHIGDVLSALDVFVLASPSEGCSLALIEAWLADLPVVATRVGAIPELERRFGQMVVPVPVGASADHLASAISRAAQQGRESDIVQRAQHVARRHLTQQTMVNNWTSYLLELTTS